MRVILQFHRARRGEKVNHFYQYKIAARLVHDLAKKRWTLGIGLVNLFSLHTDFSERSILNFYTTPYKCRHLKALQFCWTNRHMINEFCYRLCWSLNCRCSFVETSRDNSYHHLFCQAFINDRALQSIANR